MQKLYRGIVTVALLATSVSYAAAGDLKLSIANGLVTIQADQVPVSRILSEWARVGQTRIVNGEQLMMTVSLQLVDMPERKALDIVLRSASGYMAAERQFGVAGVSAFDRIMILPFSKGPVNAAPVAAAPPPFNMPRPMMPQPEADEDTPIQPPGVGGPAQPPGAMPSLPGMPQQGPGMPQQPQQVPGQPQRPGPQTLPRPGMLPGGPGQQQAVPFGTSPPQVRPPGGGGGSGI
ncbi:MAG TPA: hypothetical protein VNJ03_13630 [Vicinamibacterales bacterium]|nr:hypothetical protein [Vicinamibacterales bacterium]